LSIYAILFNVKRILLISLIPFIFNSLLILFSYYILHDKATTKMDENGLLYANSIRSLRTLIIHYKRLSEKNAVILICSIIFLFTTISLILR
jgi:hypothetical protein